MTTYHWRTDAAHGEIDATLCFEVDGIDRHPEHVPGRAVTGEPYCAVCDAYRLLDEIEDRTP